MRKLLVAALLWPLAAQAADLPNPLLKAPPQPTCTTAFCTGWYAGLGLDGNGTSADILGSGLDGSVFGAGAIPSIDGGYQFWNGSILFGVEAGVGYSVPTASTVNGVDVNPADKGWIGYQELRVGGKLSGIFGTQTPPTTQTLLAADLIAPYAAIGVAEMEGATGLETGAGLLYAITNKAMLDIGYRYIPFNSTSGPTIIKADNLVRVRFDLVFN